MPEFLPDQSVDDVITAWFEGEHTMLDAINDTPEIAWQAILEISSRELTEEQAGLLGAGALESLLAWHGAHFIDRVEQEAAHNPKFWNSLQSVWKNAMTDDIWERVKKAKTDIS
jgi:hypothetical protein